MRWLLACSALIFGSVFSLSQKHADILRITGKHIPALSKDDVDNLLGGATRDFALLAYVGTKGCSPCEMLLPVFERSVKTLAKHGLKYDNLPVYPAYIDGRESVGFSNVLELKTVPHIFLLTPQNWKCRSRSVAPDTCSTSATSLLHIEELESTTLSIVLARALKLDSSVIESLSRRTAKLSIKTIAIGFLLVALIGVLAFERIQSIVLHYGSIRAVGGLLIFWLSTSGLVYSWNEVNRKGDFTYFGRKQDGSIDWYKPMSRTQYVGEGLVFSGLSIACSLTLLLALSAHSVAQKWGVTKSMPYLPTIVGSLLGMLSVFLFLQLRSVQENKQNYYPGSFFPDGTFHRGSHRVDRAYSV